METDMNLMRFTIVIVNWFWLALQKMLTNGIEFLLHKLGFWIPHIFAIQICRYP